MGTGSGNTHGADLFVIYSVSPKSCNSSQKDELRKEKFNLTVEQRFWR